MSIASFLAICAGAAGVMMALSPVLQIRTMRRRRSSADVSIGYLSVLCVGFVTWLSYGIAIANPALIVTNVSSLSVCLATIAVARFYRRRARSATDPSTSTDDFAATTVSPATRTAP